MIFSETMVAAHGVVAAFSDLGCCWSSPRAECAGYGGGSRG